MKSFKAAIICTLAFFFLWAATSCAVIVKEDNGKKGWNKNSNNPHHNYSTNPGKGNGNHKK